MRPGGPGAAWKAPNQGSFHGWPSAWTLAGSMIVVGSGLYVLYRERKVKGLA